MVIYLLARERKQPGTFAIATRRSACAIFFAIRDDFFLLRLPPFNLTNCKPDNYFDLALTPNLKVKPSTFAN